MAFLNAPNMGLMPTDFGRAQPAPETWQSRIGGLLSGEDALFNMGIGILANNNDGTFGGAVGRGMAQGMQQTRQAQQYKLQQKTQENQNKRLERDDKAAQMQEQAHIDFDLQHPQYKGLSRLNPAAAMKIAYPSASANSADPYFKDVYIGGKVYAFNSRTGEYIPKELGGSNLPNKDDPRIQFPVSAAKSAGDNMYEVTDKKDGFLMPMTNLALETGAPPLNFLSPNSAPPQTPPQFQIRNSDANPQMQMNPNLISRTPSQYKLMADPSSTPEELAQLQSVAAADFAKNGANFAQQTRQLPPIKATPSYSTGGIKQPTKLEIKQGEADIDLAKELAVATGKAGIDVRKVGDTAIAEDVAKAKIGLSKLESSAKYTKDLVNGLLTHKGFSSSVGATYRPFFNKIDGTPEAGFYSRVKQLDGKAFLEAFESLKGGGAITEIEGDKATKAINRMSTSTSEDEFKAAAQDFNNIVDSAVKNARNKAGASQPTNEQPPAKTFNALPKTAPKGQIVRNPTTGARKQFNGLSWVDIK